MFLSNFRLYKYFGEWSSINFKMKVLSFDFTAAFISDISSLDGISIFFERTIIIKILN